MADERAAAAEDEVAEAGDCGGRASRVEVGDVGDAFVADLEIETGNCAVLLEHAEELRRSERVREIADEKKVGTVGRRHIFCDVRNESEIFENLALMCGQKGSHFRWVSIAVNFEKFDWRESALS